MRWLLPSLVLGILTSSISGAEYARDNRVVDKSESLRYFGEEPNSQPHAAIGEDSCNPLAFDCQNVCWYATADALFLRRNNQGFNQAIVLNDITGATLLSARDLNFGTVVGPRVLVGKVLNDSSAVEMSYFGLHNWSSSSTIVGNDDLSIPGDLGLATLDFLAADIMRVTYDSELHNAEANYIAGDGELKFLGGFRFMRLAEEFNIRSTDFDTDTSDYNISATNNLYGGQVGARFERVYTRFSWDVTGKAGVFGNDVSQRTYMGDLGNTTILRDSQTSGGHVAFVGDFVFNSTLQLTQHLALRGGYNLMWVDGVALANNQLDFTNTPTSGTALNSSGGAFFHGAHVGLEARW